MDNNSLECLERDWAGTICVRCGEGTYQIVGCDYDADQLHCDNCRDVVDRYQHKSAMLRHSLEAET